jgi:hypothetical protein
MREHSVCIVCRNVVAPHHLYRCPSASHVTFQHQLLLPLLLLSVGLLGGIACGVFAPVATAVPHREHAGHVRQGVSAKAILAVSRANPAHTNHKRANQTVSQPPAQTTACIDTLPIRNITLFS